MSESYCAYLDRTKYHETEHERNWNQDDTVIGKRSALEGVLSHVQPSTSISDMSLPLPVGPGILRFFSLSAIFNVVLGVAAVPVANSTYNHYSLLIQNTSGASMGQLEISLSVATNGAKEYLRANPELLGNHKFILLSEGRSMFDVDELLNYSAEEYIKDGHRLVDITERMPIKNARYIPEYSQLYTSESTEAEFHRRLESLGMDRWDRYNVLMIRQEGNMSYRMAIGWIYRESVSSSFAPGPKWEEFALG